MATISNVVNALVSAQDEAGNTTAQSATGSVITDNVVPTVTHISALSNNSRNTFAKAGDVITETFTSTDAVTSVTIGGQTASVVRGLGDDYTATYTVQRSSANGPAEVVITAQDLAGNVTSGVFAGNTGWNTVFSLNPSGPDESPNFGAYTSISGISGSPSVSTTVKYGANSASSVYFNGTSQINVINDPALQIGTQDIKISFAMKTDGNQTPYSTIFYSLGDNGLDTVIGNVPAYGNFVNFQPGNVSQYGPSWGFPNIAGTTNINDGSWHQLTTTQIDGVASIYVDGALENQQIVGLLNHDITNLAIGHLLGRYAGNWDNSFKGWINDLTIASQSSTNNMGVTIDTVAPVIAVLGQTSNSALANAGDVITQSFIATDTVTSVLIDGQAASVVHGLGNNYTAMHTVQANTLDGFADVIVTAQDLAGNTSSYAVGGNGNNYFTGTSGTDTIDGGAGSDTVSYSNEAYDNSGSIPVTGLGVAVNLATGTATDNWGNQDVLRNIEQLIGSQYADSLVGDTNNNTLNGGSGSDTLDGGAGNDYLEAGNGDDLLAGGAGNDGLFGHAGADTLSGGEGDDFLKGDEGNDLIDGGAGNDTVAYDWNSSSGISVSLVNSSGVVTGGSGTDTLSGIENIIGSFFDDVISIGDNSIGGFIEGRAGNDVLIGGNGNNYITGGSGNDTIDGGAGWDTANYSNEEYDNNISLSVTGRGVVVNLAAGTATDNWGNQDVLRNIEQVQGSRYDDTLVGDANNNNLNGGSGADSLSGGSGNDSLYGGAGADTLDGGEGDDWLKGDDGDDLINGGAGHDGIGYGGVGTGGISLSLTNGIFQASCRLNTA
jgi:Ca2+-binding RTX toxin-like protein